MGTKEKIEAVAINNMLRILPHLSDGKIIKITKLIEKIVPDESKQFLQKTRKLLVKYPNMLSYTKRSVAGISANCRQKVLENLLLQGVLKNFKVRTENEKQGHAPLFALLISPTMRCNLNCKGCYAKNYGRQNDLPFEVFDRVITEGKKMGVAVFTILGGEPFVYPRLFEIFEKHSNAYFHVYTNGTLINEEVCKKIAKLGNVGITFSIEGFKEETTFRRGEGVYKKVMAGMELAKKHGIPFGYSVCVTKNNIKKVVSDKFVNLMLKKGAVLGWYFLYMPVCGDTNLDLMPTPKQRLFLKERVDAIRTTKPILLVDFWNDAPLVGGCIAAKQYAHVNNNGDLEPCIFTHFSQVNVKDTSLMEALDFPFYSELRKIQPYNKNLFLPCMLIDNPHIFRELHAKYVNLKATHPGAQGLINDLEKDVDKYSKEMEELYTPVWEKRLREEGK
jgi:MoaA/NifB/PqqE/SkfB family radical SAM enzyme